ncbi:MAG: FeoA family protein [Planctomycetota bacterium]
MTLDQLPPGARARIVAITQGGPSAQRLFEMGFYEGGEVEVVRLAPLGDPMEVRVAGYLLSLRKEEAKAVEVESL